MKKVSFLVLAALYNVVAMAQDGASSTSVDVNLKGDGGSSFPWMWVVGGLVFVLLLVALLGRGGSRRVVEKKTIVRD